MQIVAVVLLATGVFVLINGKRFGLCAFDVISLNGEKVGERDERRGKGRERERKGRRGGEGEKERERERERERKRRGKKRSECGRERE